MLTLRLILKTLSRVPTLQLVVPGLDGPVDLGGYVGAANLAMQGTGITTYGNGLAITTLGTASGKTPDPPPSGQMVAALLGQFHRRAALVAPQSLPELRSILDQLSAAGLNELWLVVPPEISGTKESPTAGELVDEALRDTRGRSVALLPVMDLLSWGTAPEADVDYTVMGETSLTALHGPGFTTNGTDLIRLPDEPRRLMNISPFAPGVPKALLALQQQVLKKGIAGVVWRHIATPGYDLKEDGPYESVEGEFGFRTEGRLIFLRLSHVDPVDITGDSGPARNPAHFGDSVVNTELVKLWRGFRREADLSLLQSLSLVVDGSGNGTLAGGAAPTPVPIILELPGIYNLFAGWDDRRQIPSVPGEPSSQALLTAVQKQTRHALLPVPHRVLRRPARLAEELTGQIRYWDGVVLNLTPMPAVGAAPGSSSLENVIALKELLHSGSLHKL